MGPPLGARLLYSARVSAPRVFCSDLARAEREPLAGTASHARGCALISYPKRLWARDALASAGLPSALGPVLERLRERHDVVTRLVAHEGPWRGRVEVSLFPQNRRHRDVPLADVPALLERARPDEGERIERPLVACCTHGVRDACCARFGTALVRALRASAAGTGAQVEVREASHLGGDRFAPTVLVLPSGHMYGHLEPRDAPALLEAARGGAPLHACFRGSLWLDPLEQLAEVAALDAARARGKALVSLGAIARTDHDEAHATLRLTPRLEGGESLELEVRCVRRRRLVLGDCRAARTGRRGAVSVWAIEREPARDGSE